jgi:hypothetical protein
MLSCAGRGALTGNNFCCQSAMQQSQQWGAAVHSHTAAMWCHFLELLSFHLATSTAASTYSSAMGLQTFTGNKPDRAKASWVPS